MARNALVAFLESAKRGCWRANCRPDPKRFDLFVLWNRIMIKLLKKIIAGRELEELARWRHWSDEARRHLGGFDDARDALNFVRDRALDRRYMDIHLLSSNMRARQEDSRQSRS